MLKVPIICQNEDCGHKFFYEIKEHNRYVVYFNSREKDRVRMKIKRSKYEVIKKIEQATCEKCQSLTTVYVMGKVSFENVVRILPELPRVKVGGMLLPNEEISKEKIPGIPIHKEPDFLEVMTNDNIFHRLLTEINTCVENQAYSAAFVMIRKFIENLVIAILRSKHGVKANYELYFDDDAGYFRPLTKLIQEFETDFQYYKKFGLEKEHISRIKRFKGIGNYSAHNIIDLPKKKKMQGYKKDANAVIHALLHILERIEGTKKK